MLTEAGFTITGRRQRIPKTGVTIDVEAHDAAGQRWLFDIAGPFASHRGGLLRTEAVWRALGRASAIRGRLGPDVPIVLLASHLPRRPSESDTILRAAGPDAFFDAIDLLSTDARARLARYADRWAHPNRIRSPASGPRGPEPPEFVTLDRFDSALPGKRGAPSGSVSAFDGIAEVREASGESLLSLLGLVRGVERWLVLREVRAEAQPTVVDDSCEQGSPLVASTLHVLPEAVTRIVEVSPT